jgi:hypothetical protein
VRRAIVAAVVLLVIASVAVVPGRTLDVVDASGRPVPGAYVLFHREGSRFSIAHPVSYIATRHALVRSDGAGRARVPTIVFVHWPWPAQAHPHVVVDLLYAPALHNGLANLQIGDYVSRGISVSGPRDVLEDLRDDPASWLGSVQNGGYFFPRLLPEAGEDPAAPRPRQVDDLLDDLFRDYDLFLAQHGDSPRPAAEMPPFARYGTDEDRRQWRAQADADLAREPTWRPMAEREVGRDLRVRRRR